MWKNAKTYEKFAPHEYIVKQEQPSLYEKYAEKIKKYGKDEPFILFGYTKTYRYFYSGSYKYWIVGNILNRAKCKL